MRNRIVSATRPRESLPRPKSPHVFYRMHDGAGSAFIDAGGNVNAVLEGTPAATWGTAGWWAPQSAANDFGRADGPYIKELCTLPPVGGAWLIGLTYFGGNITTAGNYSLMSVGKVAANAAYEGFEMRINNAQQMRIGAKYPGSTGVRSVAMTSGSLGSDPKETNLLLHARRIAADTMLWDFYADGVSLTGAEEAFSLQANATALMLREGPSPDEGLIIGAVQTSWLPAYSRYLGNAEGSPRLRRMFMIRLAASDITLGSVLAEELHKFSGEWPRVVSGL